MLRAAAISRTTALRSEASMRSASVWRGMVILEQRSHYRVLLEHRREAQLALYEIIWKSREINAVTMHLWAVRVGVL